MLTKARILGGWVLLPLLSVSVAARSNDLSLVEVVKERDEEAVRSLLNGHADVNAAQPDGATALHWAVYWNDLGTAELLIQAGANVSAANQYGVTPLTLACTNGNAAMVETLLQAGADPNATLPSGMTALMTCARTHSVASVRSLLASGADVNAKESRRGQTALMWAVAHKHAEVVQALIEQGADIHARSTGSFTPLLFAARVGDVDSARILLAAGADVNEVLPLRGSGKDQAESNPYATALRETRNNTAPRQQQENVQAGMTALLMASASGHEELAIFLLEKGADPNAWDGGAAALHYAVIRGKPYRGRFRPSMPELVKALLAHGADPNVRLVRCAVRCKGGRGATPFLMAAAGSDPHIMRILAANGADPLLANDANVTPLMAAAGLLRSEDFSAEDLRGAREAVQLALELGNDVNAANQIGRKALHGATNIGANEIVQFLAKQGAHLDVRDKYQQTPLSIASGVHLPWIPKGEELGEVVRKDLADLLLQWGATPLTTPGYFTPVDLDSDTYRMNPKRAIPEVD